MGKLKQINRWVGKSKQLILVGKLKQLNNLIGTSKQLIV